MTTKYDEVNQQILLRSRQNDDVILETLNLFAIMLNSGEYQGYEILHEVKEKLNSAFEQYQVLMDAIHQSNTNYDLEMRRKYEMLSDRNRDNIEA